MINHCFLLKISKANKIKNRKTGQNCMFLRNSSPKIPPKANIFLILESEIRKLIATVYSISVFGIFIAYNYKEYG